jgi:hypothetical protein
VQIDPERRRIETERLRASSTAHDDGDHCLP